MKEIIIICIVFLLLAFIGCGGQEATSREIPTDTQNPEENMHIAGWMEVIIPGSIPVCMVTDQELAWFLFNSERPLLSYNSVEREWNSYSFEMDDIGPFLDMACLDEEILIITSRELLFYSAGEEIYSREFPPGFEGFSVYAGQNQIAVLGKDCSIAIPDEESGFLISEPEGTENVSSVLFRQDPDWVFCCDDTLLCFYDGRMDLWQYETLPDQYSLTCSSGELYAQSENNEILRRTGKEIWENTGLTGKLFPGGIIISEDGLYIASGSGEQIAPVPSFDPSSVVANDGNEIIWAFDDFGIVAHAVLGSIQTGLPNYETELIACTMAGQAARQQSGATSGVMPVLTTGSAAFRIYESVSSRPDPFAEFPPRRRDLRRNFSEITIEELHLVGIMLDPAGGDHAMVEDGNGVPYILYEGTELSNNTTIVEITSNEVVVVQEVTVDYGEGRGGIAVIPTIFTMRLHEEGGL